MRSEQEVNSAIEQYSHMVLRLCMVSLKNTADAEDVFQTVFLKYALSNQPFESADHEKAWLIRVTVNCCRDLLKNFFRRHTVSLEEVSEYADRTDTESSAVLEAVRSLPKKYRQVVYLHYYEGYATAEIAKLLKISRSAVTTRLQRARDFLKPLLEEV